MVNFCSQNVSILGLEPTFHERLKSISHFLVSPIRKYLLTILARSASCFGCFLKAFHQSFHSFWSHSSPVKDKVSGITLSQRYWWNNIIFLTFYLIEGCRWMNVSSAIGSSVFCQTYQIRKVWNEPFCLKATSTFSANRPCKKCFKCRWIRDLHSALSV